MEQANGEINNDQDPINDQEPQIDDKEPKIQQQEEEQEQVVEKSYASWELNKQEVQFLNDLYKEIQEAQALAEGLKDEAKFNDEIFDKTEKDINTVNNVVEVLKEESDKEDDIRFAVDNALLNLATGKRRLEDQNAQLKDVIKARNNQVRTLLMKVKEQDKLLKDKNALIVQYEKQSQVMALSLKQLQNKVEDEHRFKVVQEQLRQPKPKDFYDSNKYVDANSKHDPFDFWSGNAPNVYPGDPQKLNDVISRKQLWVAQKDQLQKFEYQRVDKPKQENFWL